MKINLVRAALLAGTGSLATQGALVHRYSFSNPAGDASGATLTDSVGGVDGLVRGGGAVFTGSGLALPGGSSETQAYGDLPNNLISTRTAVTVEGWVSVDGDSGAWARIFDFGSTESDGSGGEISGPGNTNGGGTAGLDYFLLSAARGGDYNLQRVEVRDEDPGGGGIETFDSGVATTFGEQFHFAVTWEDTGPGTSLVNYWRDGVKLTSDGVVTSNLGDLNDVNMWLGRSNWLNDANLDGTFDEFRIYDSAMDESEILASRSAGPNTVIPEPGSSILGLLGLGILLRIRRR